MPCSIPCSSELECLRHLRELRADGNRIGSVDGLQRMDGLIKLSLQENIIRSLDLRDFKWYGPAHFVYQASCITFVLLSSCPSIPRSAQPCAWSCSQTRLLPPCFRIFSEEPVIYHVQLRHTHTSVVRQDSAGDVECEPKQDCHRRRIDLCTITRCTQSR